MLVAMPETVRITVDVPATLADEGTPAKAKLLLVLDAVRSERIGWRAGALALGLSLADFLDIAREHGVPISRADVDELREDLSTLDHLLGRDADRE
jgi:hypothetical protein